MKILGLGGSIHDFSACIVVDGEVAVAIEEERLSKVKGSYHDRSTFRCKAVDYCLKYLGINIDDIDIVIGNDIIESDYYVKFADKIKLMNHHLSHASASYYLSNFERSAILVVDGRGSYTDEKNRIRETISFYTSKNCQITLNKKVEGIESDDFEIVTNSLGMFLQYVTIGIGFHEMDDKKTMKLAAKGNDRFVQDFYQFYSISEGEFIQANEQLESLKRYIKQKLEDAHATKIRDQIKADLSYAIQYHLEIIVLEMCNYLYERTGEENLCLSGSIFENATLLSKIKQLSPFKRYFVSTFMGDAGTCLGSALYMYYQDNSKKLLTNRSYSPFLGRKYTQQDINTALGVYDAKYEHLDSYPEKRLAELLEQGNLIGIFNGRSEFGRASLGSRCILGNPSFLLNKVRLNKIKNRKLESSFMAFILDKNWLGIDNNNLSSPYFVNTCYLNSSEIPPPLNNGNWSTYFITTDQKVNSLIHNLVNEFYNLTALPMVINTPLKISGATLIETPLDALEFFYQSYLDYLYIDNYLITKNM